MPKWSFNGGVTSLDMSNDDTDETYYDMDDDGIDTKTDWKSVIFDVDGGLECPICGNEWLCLVKSRYLRIDHKGNTGTHTTINMEQIVELGWYGKIEPWYICPACYEREGEEIEEWEEKYGKRGDCIHHHNLTEEMLEQFWYD